jgi:hypothetical protein
MSTVSVIVPCYNYGRYLGECVKSVLRQAGVDVRLLIIDDASRDDSAEVAEELGRRDGRVTVRRHEVNRGHIATYNEGLDWATGDYTLLLSADDLLTPGALARAAGLMDDYPEIALVYGRQIVFHPDDPPPVPREAGYDYGRRVIPGTELIESMCAAGANPVETPTVLVRTSVQKELGGYRPDLPHTADMELWLRFAARASVGVVAADQALKRMHSQNMQLQFLGTSLGDVRQRRSAFEVFFAGRGARLPGRERLERRARGNLALEAFWAANEAFETVELSRSEELIAFALETDPGLRSRPEWSRYRWKRRIGPRVWKAVSPLLDRLRGVRRLRLLSESLRPRGSAPTAHGTRPEPDGLAWRSLDHTQPTKQPA